MTLTFDSTHDLKLDCQGKLRKSCFSEIDGPIDGEWKAYE